MNQNIKTKRLNLKWVQLKQKQQICVSNTLRIHYIRFVLENNRKPNKTEKEFIIACAYMELEEKEIFIAENELRKYFESRLVKYDASIKKLKF